MKAVENPRCGHDCDGVPDGDGSYTTLVMEHTEVSLTAVAHAADGSVSVAGITVHPSSTDLYETLTSIAGSADTSSLGWTGASGAQNTNILANFNAHRPVGIRARMYPTSQLSTMNGRYLCARWPKGMNSATETTSCAPGTIKAISYQPFVKEGTANDPDQEGISMFWCPTRVSSLSGGINAFSSLQWLTNTNQGINEGFTMMWQGVASSGTVQNDMIFKVEIDALYECQVPSTAYGLWGNAKVNYGSPELLNMALEKLAQIEASSSIYFEDQSAQLKAAYRGRRFAPPVPIEVSPARALRQFRAALEHLENFPEDQFSREDLEAYRAVQRILKRPPPIIGPNRQYDDDEKSVISVSSRTSSVPRPRQ